MWYARQWFCLAVHTCVLPFTSGRNSCACVYGMARARVVQVGCMIVNKAISFGGA